MMSVIYADCRKKALYDECRYAECHYAECRYAEWHYAECRSASQISQRFCQWCVFQVILKLASKA
jgi:hypothetical protein